MVVEGEQPAAVEAHDLEDAVAAQEPVVGGGDLRLRGVADGAVEDREHGANASPSCAAGRSASRSLRDERHSRWPERCPADGRPCLHTRTAPRRSAPARKDPHETLHRRSRRPRARRRRARGLHRDRLVGHQQARHRQDGTSSLGRIVVDGHSHTLYLFEKDKGGKSACSGACAQNWPPLLTKGTPKAGAGAKASLLGTTKRADGTTQVTYNKHPLYTFVGDEGKRGATKGEGLDAFGAKWYVVAAKGTERTRLLLGLAHRAGRWGAQHAPRPASGAAGTVSMPPPGIEPGTFGLRVRCSAS